MLETAEQVEHGRRQEGVLSEQEIRRLATQRREQGKGANLSFIEGIKEEVQLIEWPRPLQAVQDTVVVISLVGSLAAFMFVVNAALAEGSRALYALPFNLDKSIAQQIWEAFQQ
ncbi:hypothetical protein WJX81_002932 [Elliptochloris bilobata]|uniref:Uncharacterized protein n=1 Tax=Elliptochloris bilobata TaxID=381761 RepID=A0AAW1RJV5_9CHLO